MYSKEAETLLKTRAGYRSEDAYGEGYRGAREVILHEIEELGNEEMAQEIAENLGLAAGTPIGRTLEEIERRYGRDAKVIWLATREGAEQYSDDPEIAGSIREYRIPEGATIICDLGGDGQLFLMTAEEYMEMERNATDAPARK